MRTKFLRTRLLTASRMQWKYLMLLMVSMVIPMVFVGGCLYYLIFNIMAEQLGIPEHIAYNLFPVLNKINIMLVIGLPPLFIILIAWGAVLSHRFAGPIDRLEKEIDKISESKDYAHRIRIRKSDDLKPVADALNRLLDKIEGR